MRIAILTPTRGRPEQYMRMVDSTRKLADDSDETVVVHYAYVDVDDPSLKDYSALVALESNNSRLMQNFYLCKGPAQSVSKSWNDIAEWAINQDADVLVMGNDDVVYRTQDWNILLKKELEKYEDGLYCAWMNDLNKGEKHCAFPIISRRVYEALGYFTPGIFNFGYNDTWLFDIFKRIDRLHYMPDIVAEHMHVNLGKQEADDTYNRNRNQSRGNLYRKDAVIWKKTETLRNTAASLLTNKMTHDDEIEFLRKDIE